MKHLLRNIIILLITWTNLAFGNSEKPFVIGKLKDQMGNNMFQIATTCAHAWDNGADPYFPDLSLPYMSTNYSHVFFRFNHRLPTPPVTLSWTLPTEFNFMYHPIPYTPNMEIQGTFQTEHFFAHHRERLLNLFAPHPDDLTYIQEKYKYILEHPNTVGVQIRWFGVPHDSGWWIYLAQYGCDFFEKAMAEFPSDALFVVSSNDSAFARLCIAPKYKNIIFLEGEHHYIDFFLLSMCKHNIISNSSFGWWAAWLNKNPNKIVIAPQHWINPKWSSMTPFSDVLPSSWIKINAKWNIPQSNIEKAT